jgi:hypothetical protein
MGEWKCICIILDLALVGVNFPFSRPSRFTPGARASVTSYEPRAGLSAQEKINLLQDMAIVTIPTELLRCHEYGDEVKLNLGLNVVPKENAMFSNCIIVN